MMATDPVGPGDRGRVRIVPAGVMGSAIGAIIGAFRQPGRPSDALDFMSGALDALGANVVKERRRRRRAARLPQRPRTAFYQEARRAANKKAKNRVRNRMQAASRRANRRR